MDCSQAVKSFSWWVQGHTFQTDALVLPLGSYDMILGMDWLEQFCSMNCDWMAKWVEFSYNGTTVKLRGIVPHSSVELQEISTDHLFKS
jgi:hypothetical protein